MCVVMVGFPSRKLSSPLGRQIWSGSPPAGRAHPAGMSKDQSATAGPQDTNHAQLVAGLLDAQPRARGELNWDEADKRLADAHESWAGNPPVRPFWTGSPLAPTCQATYSDESATHAGAGRRPARSGGGVNASTHPAHRRRVERRRPEHGAAGAGGGGPTEVSAASQKGAPWTRSNHRSGRCWPSGRRCRCR